MKIEAIATDYLGRVRLRLLEETERERFDLLLETRHYLKSSRIGLYHVDRKRGRTKAPSLPS